MTEMAIAEESLIEVNENFSELGELVRSLELKAELDSEDTRALYRLTSGTLFIFLRELGSYIVQRLPPCPLQERNDLTEDYSRAFKERLDLLDHVGTLLGGGYQGVIEQSIGRIINIVQTPNPSGNLSLLALPMDLSPKYDRYLAPYRPVK